MVVKGMVMHDSNDSGGNDGDNNDDKHNGDYDGDGGDIVDAMIMTTTTTTTTTTTVTLTMTMTMTMMMIMIMSGIASLIAQHFTIAIHNHFFFLDLFQLSSLSVSIVTHRQTRSYHAHTHIFHTNALISHNLIGYCPKLNRLQILYL